MRVSSRGQWHVPRRRQALDLAAPVDSTIAALRALHPTSTRLMTIVFPPTAPVTPRAPLRSCRLHRERPGSLCVETPSTLSSTVGSLGRLRLTMRGGDMSTSLGPIATDPPPALISREGRPPPSSPVVGLMPSFAFVPSFSRVVCPSRSDRGSSVVASLPCARMATALMLRLPVGS